MTYPLCSQYTCGLPAVRAVLNVFGFVFLECRDHAGWSVLGYAGRIPDGAELELALSSYPRTGVGDSLSVVLPPGEAMALLVMGG